MISTSGFGSKVDSSSRVLIMDKTEIKAKAKVETKPKVTIVEKKKTVTTEATMARNQFYHALTELMRSFEQAKGRYSGRTSGARLMKSKANLLQKAMIAAKAGNFPLARDAIGGYRYLESMGSRKKRATFNNIVTLLKNQLSEGEIRSTFGLLDNTALSFVFDTTGSMGNELAQTKEICREITNYRTNHGDPLQHYVLTEFNDPEFGPAHVFEEKGEFMSKLDSLTINGGGDCAEYSMSGIQLAMMNTLDQNPIFVFTDAPPKDAEASWEVIDIAVMYGDPIFFFFAPDCGTDDSVYQEVATETGGMVLPLRESDISKLGDLVDKLIVGTGTVASGMDSNLARRKRSTGGTTEILINVDTTISELIITVTFSHVTGTVTLHNPSKIKENESANSRNLEKIVIYEVKKPIVGKYKMKVTTVPGTTFTYKAMSASSPNLDFDFFFVETHKYSSSTVPVAVDQVVVGGESSLRITLTDNQKIDTSLTPTVELVAIHNSAKVLTTATNVKWLGTNFLSADVVIPSKKFRLKVSGLTKLGDLFERVGKTIVKPRELTINLYYTKNENIGPPGSSGSVMWRLYYTGDQAVELFTAEVKKTKLEEVHLSRSIKIAKGGYGLVSYRFKIPTSAKKGEHFTAVVVVKSAGGLKAVSKCTVLVT